jgi:sulfate adenylyltransferase subunit 1
MQMNDSMPVKGYLDMELLRFTTAGSVDDGKSTLIGRLLFDSKAIFQDQIEAIERASLKIGEGDINLALLTDGLRAEREQGITIDVAYRYFATPKRKFIIADTPGHIQYTRNMVTGASTADAAIILIDARNGVTEQTRRHSYIASLLQIKHIIVCVNKMDLVNFSHDVFIQIQSCYNKVAKKLADRDIHFVPISAKQGDNVVYASEKMGWYTGPTLMNLLETIPVSGNLDSSGARFPVQYVIRPQFDSFHDYRGYAGRVASGVFRIGDKVKILPTGLTSSIRSIDLFGKSFEEAFPPQSVVITLEDDIDISRGDMIMKENDKPVVSNEIDLMVCWLSEKPLLLGSKYAVKHTTADARCIIKDIAFKLNISTLENDEAKKNVELNEMARITIKTTRPLVYDAYNKNRVTGSLILIDEATNITVGAGMIV